MWWISNAFIWIPLFLFFVYFSYKKGGYKFTLVIIGGAGLCVLLADRISVELFKEVFQRYRPTHHSEIGDLVHTVIKPNGEEYRGGLYSFVSSHATNFMAIGSYFFFHFRSYSKKWLWLFPWVALISYSRIYLGVHYPSDILCGGILGLLIAILVYQLSIRIPQFKINLPKT